MNNKGCRNRLISLIMCFAMTVLLAVPVTGDAFAETAGQQAESGADSLRGASSVTYAGEQADGVETLTDDSVLAGRSGAGQSGTDGYGDEAGILNDEADLSGQSGTEDPADQAQEAQQQGQTADQSDDSLYPQDNDASDASDTGDKGVDVLNPEDVASEEAGAGSVSEEASELSAKETTKKKKKYVHSRKFVMDEMNYAFNQPVAKNVHLIADKTPRDFYVKGYKSKITLKWNAPVNNKVDGYYIMRLAADGITWTQIAEVAANKTSYTDVTANTADTDYSYSVIAFRKSGDNLCVSHACDWASAITTRSKKKNVYSVSITNPARISAISIGKSAKVALEFPSKPYTKKIRWTSSDETIATVTGGGTIKGVSKGTVTIYGRMHTGNVLTTKVYIVEPGTADAMVTVMKSWMDYSSFNGKHKGIIDIYNEQRPLPVSYTMKYSDAWCDASVTAAAMVSGNYDLIGGECSVPRHIEIFKKKKIWKEDGTITPKKGDLIIYSWHKYTQPNNASASHIGIVESVKNGQITTIEGNMGSGVVGRRVIKVGYGCIRGFARPKYAKSGSSKK